MNYLKDDPIIALSTGENSAALAVLRLSSPKPLNYLRKAFSFAGDFKSHEAVVCKILDGDRVLDQVVATYFAAPKSYTGEFVLELSVHGNQFSVKRILSFFKRKYGVRLAEAGEFTYRALKHGKLTLSQVEGLDILLNAKSDFGIESGLAALQGELQQKFLSLRKRYIDLRAAVELSIDFSEDIGPSTAQQNFATTLQQFARELHALHQRCQSDLSNLLNPSVILLGRSNAGKSTLFNRLLRENRSIIGERPGTTRDYISEYLAAEDINFRLIDTAGLRQTTVDTVEREGILRAQALADKAFYRIFVLNPLQERAIDQRFLPQNITTHTLKQERVCSTITARNLGQIGLKRGGATEAYDQYAAGSDNEADARDGLKCEQLPQNNVDAIVLTHADCPGFTEALKKLDLPINTELYFSGPIGAADKENLPGPIGATEKENICGPIGAKSIEHLPAHLAQKYRQQTEREPMIAERQRHKITDLFDKFSHFQLLAQKTDDIAVLSSEINLLGNDVDQLLGIVSSDEVLDKVFSNFCIGK